VDQETKIGLSLGWVLGGGFLVRFLGGFISVCARRGVSTLVAVDETG